MSNRDRILEALASSMEPLDDDELSRRALVSPRQSVNTLCRAMQSEGILRRFPGAHGKIVNEVIPDVGGKGAAEPGPGHVATEDVFVESGTSLLGEQLPGDSREQRVAEGHMLAALGKQLGRMLAPRRLVHPSGARVEVDGADDDLTVLVECWAHQGPAKPAQKNKLVVDATKLNWIARSLQPAPQQLILCVSDPAAVAHLTGWSWQAQAIRELGLEIRIVSLDRDVVAALTNAQKRQSR